MENCIYFVLILYYTLLVS